MLTFNAIDVETANADRASICQIGIVHVVDGELVDSWQTLVDPQDWFDPWNVGIHGIKPDDVADSPTLPEVRDELRRRLRGSVLVSHTAFDRVAFDRGMKLHQLEPLRVTWLDSAKIVRRAWPDHYARSGYGLQNVAHDLGIKFKHHDALEDARAAAQIVVRACSDTGMDVLNWLERVEHPIGGGGARRPRTQAAVKRTGCPDGRLSGESVVFTGKLKIPLRVASDMAASAGCNVTANVSKKTTMLVVGVQDKSRLAGYDKSTKHRKAEALIAEGSDVKIISEQDFSDLTNIDGA